MAKIPPQAKKVFSGMLFDVYHWEQEMFDGTKKIFEMLKRIPAVNVIATVNEKIIILDQEQPGRAAYPSLPGGKIDPGETPETAAHRELSEETGYASKDLTALAYYNENSKVDFDDYVFVAKNCHQVTKQHLDNGEKITIRLVSFEEFIETARHPLFAIPQTFRIELWEAALDQSKKTELKKKLGL